RGRIEICETSEAKRHRLQPTKSWEAPGHLARSRRTMRKQRGWWRPIALLVALTAGVLWLVGQLGGGDVRETSAPEAAGCVDGPVTRGIDVSYHQDRVDWRRVREAGIEFAFIRLSDGLTFDDPRFHANWDG